MSVWVCAIIDIWRQACKPNFIPHFKQTGSNLLHYYAPVVPLGIRVRAGLPAASRANHKYIKCGSTYCKTDFRHWLTKLLQQTHRSQCGAEVIYYILVGNVHFIIGISYRNALASMRKRRQTRIQRRNEMMTTTKGLVAIGVLLVCVSLALGAGMRMW